MSPTFMTHAAVAFGLALPAACAVAGGNPLAAERWKTRPVVIVVPTAEDALLGRLNAALQEPAMREGFRERDMALYTVVAGQGSRNGKDLPPASTTALLDALDLKPQSPATFVLVGKDGSVKMKEGPDVDLRAVFAEIDRMPMRQQR